MPEDVSAQVRRLSELAGKLEEAVKPASAKARERVARELKGEIQSAEMHVRQRSMTESEREAAAYSPFW